MIVVVLCSAAIAVADKLQMAHDHFRDILLRAVLCVIRARLDAALYGGLAALSEILTCYLCLLIPYDTRDKVGLLLAVRALADTVNGQRKRCDWFAALRVSRLYVSR